VTNSVIKPLVFAHSNVLPLDIFFRCDLFAKQPQHFYNQSSLTYQSNTLRLI
jgi:hypothetical protein